MIASRPTVLLLLLAIVLPLGCQPGKNTASSTETSERHGSAPERSLQHWIVLLSKGYREDGIPAFRRGKKELHSVSHDLQDDPHYDVVAMVLGLSDTPVTEKEAGLATDLRRLAASIEEHPGQSAEAWQSLRDKVYSYSYGNGPVDKDALPSSVVHLYETIACKTP